MLRLHLSAVLADCYEATGCERVVLAILIGEKKYTFEPLDNVLTIG
jgi:hypothetical protein